MIRHFLSRQFATFLVVGGVAALANWLARFLLSLWLPFAWAVTTAYVAGMATAFFLNRWLVFPNSDKDIRLQMRDFVLVNLASFPLVWFISIQVNHWLIAHGIVAHSEELAHAVGIAAPVLVSFLAHKFFSFKAAEH